ncbi:hypothetical protein DMN91_006519 [Ooceraea biroi]|uniref:Reverse transcriptase domain-containing protein n=1 Tax=Ooceraea biroi TaxID=2015173 RepID=A0A3L8DQF0_OOCBI|nr:uncharacterized protein LOC105287497 [Ooceraea biroi]XP_026826218.1 uncharacterized protein LOC113562112 [Ooceraea biroi]RLU21169.1 hypothetical protein DMN91_005542 [Ooceraea biroi]RLU22139.1 hypothetical protein DMN91_006519 [Ooceraea biroi]
MTGGCKQCGKKHNTLLHNEEGLVKSEMHKERATLPIKSNLNVAIGDVDKTNLQTTHSVNSASSKGGQVLLATAPVIMYDKSNKPHRCRAFLDAGSQLNLITKSLSQRLQLAERQDNNIVLSGIGCKHTNTLGSVQANIYLTVNEFKTKLSFAVMDRITEPMPSIQLNKESLGIPSNIKIADEVFELPGDVDILLGSGVFWDLLCIGQIKLGRNLPVLQKTKLGWIIGGNAPIIYQQEVPRRTVLSVMGKEPGLEQQLERFWKLEECSLETSQWTQEQTQCEREFRSTYQRDPFGRFIVHFSFKEDPSQLGDSRETVLKRLRSVNKRLYSNLELKTQYIACIEEYLSLGHMTKVDKEINQRSPYCYYLPYHAVVKEDRSTTKLRVVFDASAKTTSGKSLNDILLVGPTIQQELFSILVRFRQHPYVLTGDIEKMYRQIYVHEKYRGLQRILWQTEPTAPVEEFILNIVAFGLTLSPFVAVRCLHQLAYDHQELWPKISQIILREFYVDDMITGADSEDELKNIQSRIRDILTTGGFRIRK